MKMNIKGLMLGFAAFAMAVSTVVSTAQPAAAVGPCGSSYTKVGSYNMAAGNAKGGTLEIYWSNTKKNNCAVARCYDWSLWSELYQGWILQYGCRECKGWNSRDILVKYKKE